MNKRMGKQKVVCLYNEILLSNIKNQLLIHFGELQIKLSERSQPQNLSTYYVTVVKILENAN